MNTGIQRSGATPPGASTTTSPAGTKILGKRELWPEDLTRAIDKIEKQTEGYSTCFLNIALGYGGRDEITDAVKRICELFVQNKIRLDEIDKQLISKHLYTSHLPNPEPDLIVRTSGEMRLSNFLTWQSVYSELVFVDTYWPDFRRIDLLRAVRTYQKRSRRVGL
jgi:tritrans,polycis-undecaprenyl-diphosphate synthase [geranylgeranyl-diphosphate specific]